MKFPEITKKQSGRGLFGIMIPILIGICVMIVLAVAEPNTGYFTYPIYILVLGFLSAFLAIGLSSFFATFFVSIHKTAVAIQKKSNLDYFLDPKYSNKESLREFLAYNIWYSVGVTFVALRFSGGEELTQESLGFILIFFVSLALIFSSGINTSLYLIQQKGIFFKNSNDGSTINLGSDLRRVVNWALGPMQIIFFIYTVISLTDYSIVIFLGITITICVCTSVISYYIIRQRDAWNSMFERFSNKIDNMILLEKKHTAILGSTSKDSKISKHPKFCPLCSSNTQIFYDKAYCPKCKNYL